jgi:hypothetical protein
MPAAVFSPREADVTHDADQPPAGHQGVEALLPDLIQLDQELLIVVDPTELALALAVLLESPVRRAGEVR